MKKISTRIVFFIVLCTFLASAAIGTLAVLQASATIKEEAYYKFEYASKNLSAQFSNDLVSIESMVNTINSVIQATFLIDSFTNDANSRASYMKFLNNTLLETAQHADGIQGIYVAINPELTGAVHESWFITDTQGNFVYQEPEDISAFYPDNKDMEWYYNPIRENQGIWSPPYVDATISLEMISYTEAIFIDDTLIGVVGIDIDFGTIQDTINNMKLYDTCYSFLIDENYMVLHHPDTEKGTYLKEWDVQGVSTVVDHMKTNSSAVTEYIYEGKKKIMGFSRMNNGWIFGVSAEAKEVFKPIHMLRNNVFLIALIVFSIAAIIGYYLSKSITKPLLKLHDMAVKISNGNHSIRIHLDTGDELESVSKSINKMTVELVEANRIAKSTNDDLEFMAYHDLLTNLSNRRHAELQLANIMELKKQKGLIYGVMLVSIDNFKEIGKTSGNGNRDECIKQISELLPSTLPAGFTLSRYSSDEFLAIFKRIKGLVCVEKTALGILGLLEEPLSVNGIDLNISCNIGVAFFDDETMDKKMLLHNAETALNEARKETNNSYCVFDSSSQ